SPRMPTPDRAMVTALPMEERLGSALHRLVAHGRAQQDFDTRIIPVSVFWGRNPERETSLLRILFAHASTPGRLRKLFIVAAQGRNVVVHFGRPVGLRAFLDANPRVPAIERKLARVLRVHFQRQRIATLGPPLSRRSQVINAVLGDPQVRRAIAHSAEAEGISMVAARAQARAYADEIAADYSNIAIAFMLRVLNWLWGRVYAGVNVAHLQRLRATAQQTELVYLPSHRSHMDYLLVSYLLYTEALALPQIAAGINLNFWPVGGLLRRCGAFYLRRSFKGNRLYAAVFRGYVDVLLEHGSPLKFYPEGGRSRTGRLLPPKTGLLSMVAESCQRPGGSPVALVPVFIGYDRVMEVDSYFAELRGERPRKGESVAQLLRGVRKIVRTLARGGMGRAYLSFGEPLHLNSWVGARGRGLPAAQAPTDTDEPGQAFSEWVDELAREMMVRINASATLSATALVALVLLGSPQRAVAADEMQVTLEQLLALARAAPYSADISLPEGNAAALLAEAEPLARIRRVAHAWGDVLTVDARQAVLLTYTRNNVLHLFALPSLLANFLVHGDSRAPEQLVQEACALYPLLAAEYSLRWDEAQIADALRHTLTAMQELGLLVPAADAAQLRCAPIGTPAFASLLSLARMMRESLERYAMTAVLLAHQVDAGSVRRADFERQCQLMAERMAILTGRHSPEFFDLGLFRNHLRVLADAGLLQPRGGELTLAPGLAAVAEHSLQLLGPDIRQNILQLTGGAAPTVSGQ
ncbi:MAG: glycerol-3-phosphate 1-O-acyltransferase PlsB, partial [Salinisphaera sp.]|nr:glycerol-3-phosphate 1-O-acyltransferase PlsB [Salinisphaera sp.]